jgi:5-methylcytosine-specific restriction endonuclease McrA
MSVQKDQQSVVPNPRQVKPRYLAQQTCRASDCEQKATLPSGFCSKRCYHRDYARKHHLEENAKKRQRYAVDSEYKQTKLERGRLYSQTEKGKENVKKRRERRLERYPDCEKDYAATHSVEKTERARQWRLTNVERSRKLFREAAGRRRSRKLNQFVEDVDPQVVWDRDQGICGICKDPADHDRFDIDHIVPISKGGEHSYVNAQLAHPSCNYRKSDKVMA